MQTDVKTVFKTALAMHQNGRIEQAEGLYTQILEAAPNHEETLHLLGVIKLQKKLYQQCIKLISRALEIDPNFSAAYGNLAVCYEEMKRPEKAAENYKKAIDLNPDEASLHLGLGSALMDFRDYKSAAESFSRAIKLKPEYAEAYCNLGIIEKIDENYLAAIEKLDKAISLKPSYAQAHCERANVLNILKRYEEAMAAYMRALHFDPKLVAAHAGAADLFVKLGEKQEAIRHFEKALSLASDIPLIRGKLLFEKRSICDWSDNRTHIDVLKKEIAKGQQVVDSFSALSMIDDPALLKSLTELNIKLNYKLKPIEIPAPPTIHKKKISIGYFSSDLRQHPVAWVMSEVFENHNRSDFSIYAFAINKKQAVDDIVRKRLRPCFDELIEVEGLKSQHIRDIAKEKEIDIAIDLNGYTGTPRTDVFLERVAPLQINYLGYAGTMGSDLYDYLIADKITIPEDAQKHYAEKIIRLPHSYMPNDSTRKISDRVFEREELGLPKTGFVFCSFNANYKINAEVFDSWMHIMKKVEGSVLWLREYHSNIVKNLRFEAKRRGIAPERLIFAPIMATGDHLARHRNADLFLDTLPFNAHSTASDALWAGLPLLTEIGDTFAGRVGASLVHSLDANELIASSKKDFINKAIELANNPEKLKELRQKIWQNRNLAPGFSGKNFAKNLELAYQTIYERYASGLSPTHINL